MTVAMVFPIIEKTKRFLRPNRVAAQPVIDTIMVPPTLNDVMTQEIWSGVVEKVPCICGSPTPTIIQVRSH